MKISIVTPTFNEIENIENKLYLFRHIIDQASSPEEHELNHLDELLH